MEFKKRRAIASSLGRIDLGSVKEREVLQVHEADDEIDVPNYHFSNDNFSDEDVEKELREAKEERKNLQKRAPKNAIQRLEILTGIGRLVREVEIDGVKFLLRSLKSKETREVLETAAKAETNVGEALLIRNSTLAYSIYEIDGMPLSYFAGSEKDFTEIIDEMDSRVVSKLYEEYTKMMSEHNDALKTDLGTEPKEIVDNIKK